MYEKLFGHTVSRSILTPGSNSKKSIISPTRLLYSKDPMPSRGVMHLNSLIRTNIKVLFH